MIRRLFLDHPASVEETYLEHAAFAGRFGVLMVAGGMAALLHAIVPAWFTRTGSTILVHLNRRVIEQRRAKGQLPDAEFPFDWVI